MADSDFEFTMVPLMQHRLFWITFEGAVTAEQLGIAHAEFRRHPAYAPRIDELLDFSTTTINRLSQSDISSIRRFMKTRRDRHHIQSAIVVGSDVDYGVGRMFGSLVEADPSVPVEYGIFRDITEAVAWLRPGEAEAVIAARDEAD